MSCSHHSPPSGKVGLHDSFQVESLEDLENLIYNVGYKHLLKFQTRRETPCLFSCPQEEKIKKPKKKILNFKFQEKCSA